MQSSFEFPGTLLLPIIMTAVGQQKQSKRKIIGWLGGVVVTD